MQSTRRETAGDLLLLFILLIPTWAPLTRPGLPRWLPGALPVFRLYAREQGGTFDAGWVLDSGFAYAVARAFRLLGLDGVTALKMSLALGMMLLGLVVWLWARRLWGPRAGVLAALLALYTPVLLSGLYILGGIALPWFLLGLALVGLGISSRGWMGWGMALAGAALAALNATFLFKTPLAFTRIPLFRLIEAPWFWGTNSVGLESDPAWSLGLPLLALAMMALWLGWRKESHRLSVISYPWVVGMALLVGALVAPGDLALALILAASLPLAVAASGLLALAPTLKTPAAWAALLILPLLAAGPALSPDFQAYPIPERPAGVFGDPQILLIDAGMAPPAPGQTLALDVVWQATQPIDFDYNLFIHVTDDAGHIVTQLDGQPLDDRPMTTWRTGEVLPAHYELAIPADAPASLHVRLGLYNWQTGARLLQPDSSDAITILP